MKLQEKLLRLMKENKLNQKQLAEKASVTESSMSKYLSGDRKPRTDVLVKFAKVFNVSVNFLVDDEKISESAYSYASTALARCKDELTDEEIKKLIKFLLEE